MRFLPLKIAFFEGFENDNILSSKSYTVTKSGISPQSIFMPSFFMSCISLWGTADGYQAPNSIPPLCKIVQKIGTISHQIVSDFLLEQNICLDGLSANQAEFDTNFITITISSDSDNNTLRHQKILTFL